MTRTLRRASHGLSIGAVMWLALNDGWCSACRPLSMKIVQTGKSLLPAKHFCHCFVCQIMTKANKWACLSVTHLNLVAPSLDVCRLLAKFGLEKLWWLSSHVYRLLSVFALSLWVAGYIMPAGNRCTARQTTWKSEDFLGVMTIVHLFRIGWSSAKSSALWRELGWQKSNW